MVKTVNGEDRLVEAASPAGVSRRVAVGNDHGRSGGMVEGEAHGFVGVDKLTTSPRRSRRRSRARARRMFRAWWSRL